MTVQLLLQVLLLTSGFALCWLLYAFLRQIRQAVLDFQAALRSADVMEHLTDVQDRLVTVEKSLKRLHSRAGMRELRERRANGEDSEQSPATLLEKLERKHGLRK